MQSSDLVRFKTVGLQNLVRELARVVRSAGDPDHVVLNMTGGDKAQVAVAFGQRLILRG